MAVERKIDIVVQTQGTGEAAAALGGVDRAAGSVENRSQKMLGSLLSGAGGFKGLAVAAGAAGGVMLGLQVIDKVVGWLNSAAEAAIKFGKELISAAEKEEEHRNTLIALTGSLKEGEKAHADYQKRIKESPFAEATYSVNEYNAAVTKGLGKAQLDASEAFRGINGAAAGFVDTLQQLQGGEEVGFKKTKDFTVVLKEAGLTQADLSDKTKDHRAQADLLMVALEKVADRQREAADNKFPGQINAMTNAWGQYKEEVGGIVTNALTPLAIKLREVFTEFLKTKDAKQLFVDIAAAIKENEEPIKELIDLLPEIVRGGIQVAEVLLKLAPIFTTLLSVAVPVVKSLTQAFEGTALSIKYDINMLQALGQALKGDVKGGWESAKKASKDYFDSLMTVATGKGAAAGGAEREPGVMGPLAAPSGGGGGGGGKGKGKAGEPWKNYGMTEAQWKEMQRLGMSPAQYMAMHPVGGEGILLTTGEEDRASTARAASMSIEGRRAYLSSKAEVNAGKEATANLEKEREKKQAEIEKMFQAMLGEAISSGMSDAIIEGLKSGDLAKAISDFGAQFGEEVARQLISKLIAMGIIAILSALTGGGAAGLQGIMMPKAQKGMYTGGYEGPVFVHRNEVIAPLDTIGALTTLVNRSVAGVRPQGGASQGVSGQLVVQIDERASDLVDVHRANSVARGNGSVRGLQAVSF